MAYTEDDHKRRCDLHTEKIQALELNMVEMKGDVKHIRERIDNGLSATISKVWDKMNSMAVERAAKESVLETCVKMNSDFIDKFKHALIFVSVSSVFGGIVAILWRIAHDFITNGI